MRKYFNESHRKYSEACQKEVAETSKLLLSEEAFREQIRRNREESILRAKIVFLEPEGTVITGNHRAAMEKAGTPLSDEFGPHYAPEALRNLSTVLRAFPEASIVFISRKSKRNWGQMKGAWLHRLAPGLITDYLEVKGDSSAARGEAIREWYRANGVEEKNYVVFCNRNEFLPEQMHRIVLIHPRWGISRKAARQAVKILKQSPSCASL